MLVLIRIRDAKDRTWKQEGRSEIMEITQGRDHELLAVESPFESEEES